MLEEQKAVFVSDLSQEMLKNTLTWLHLHQKLPDEAPIYFRCLPPGDNTDSCQRQSCRGRNSPPKTWRCFVLGVSRCSRARVRSVEGQRRAVPATSGERAGSAQAVAGDQQSHRLKLDIDELFRSASASIRTYFRNDFTGFWLIDKQSNQLECVVLDFPSGKGLLTPLSLCLKLAIPIRKSCVPTSLNCYGRRRSRSSQPESLTGSRLSHIAAMAIAPLVTASGPLGVMTMGSRQPDNFGQEDLDLLSQISTQIALAVDNAIVTGRVTEARDRLEEERLYLESEIRSEYNFEDIVGKSAALRKALDQIAIVAPTQSTVLLHGETGTGKELFARAIHNLSPRRERTFVRLNCAAIPSGLVESELVWARKGRLHRSPDAKRKAGSSWRITEALFLDEIGDITLEHPAEAPARPAGAGIRATGKYKNDPCGRSLDCGYAP